MKIIVRKSDSVVIWGTNNNNSVIEVIDNNLIIDGQVIVTDVNEDNFELVDQPTLNLLDPFFVGYVSWVGYLTYTETYQEFNSTTKNCLQEVRNNYYLKSQDTTYTQEEKQSFTDYYTLIDEILNIEYLDPTFSYPCPPDENFPYYPPCSND
jgi:hypothetical protein